MAKWVLAEPTTDTVSAWNEVISSCRITFFSNILRNSNSWLSIGGFTCLNHELLTHCKFAEFVCQQWRQHDISRNRWGTKLKNSSVQNYAFSICLITNTLKLYSLLLNFVKITIQNGNYKEIPSWKGNYGEFMYGLRHLTKYSWWIPQLSSASIIVPLWFEGLLAVGHFVNSWHLLFLCGTIIDEESASKTEKKINHGNDLSQSGGVSQYFREACGPTERKGPPQIAWKFKKNCIETLDFSISIHLKILQ